MRVSRQYKTLSRLILPLAATVPLITCSEHSPTQPGTSGGPSFVIVILSSNPQSGQVGSTLPELRVQVKDSKGRVLYGEVVNFVVTGGGGSVFAPTVVTDLFTGVAQEVWTLGPVAGAQSVEARIIDPGTGNPLSVATFTATATAAPASVMSAQAGNGLTAVAGSQLPISPAVLVTDRFGNPIAGVTVTFAVTGGGGGVVNASQATGTNGLASAGTWTLGTQAGTNTLTATSTGLSGSPVTFTATGINAAATQLIPVTTTVLTGTVVAGTILAATGPAVRVVDKNNNGVPNVAVTFTVTGPNCPSCSAYPGTSPAAPAKIAGVNSVTTLTDASGRASGGDWTLSTLAGANTLQATAVGMNGSPVIFTATGTAATASLLFKKAGDGQTAPVGTAVTTPPAIQVTDVYGNPSSSGISVMFTVQSGGGSVSGAPSVTLTTDLTGAASATWTLGSLAGANSLAATGVSRTVTFTATATGPAGLNIANYRGDGQTQAAGASVPIAPAAQVTDLTGHPVAGVQVVFSVTAGGGSITGATQVTDANGIATVGTWTLGTAAGVNELQAAFNTGVGTGYTIFVATGSLAIAWQQSLSGTGDVWSIATGPIGLVFVATNTGVYRSTDNGATWTLVGFPSLIAAAVGINPVTKDVYTGLNCCAEALQGLPGTPRPGGGGGSGVYVSTDNGGTWGYVLGNPGAFGFAFTSSGAVIAATTGPTGAPGGLFLSTNKGASWTYADCCYPRSFAITTNGNIFAGDTYASGGISRSTNLGTSWTQVGLGNTPIYSLAATASDHLFAGTVSTGIFRSTDGTSWIPVNAGFTNPVTSLAVNSASQVFAGGFGGGVVASMDDGATWTQLNAGLTDLHVESLAVSPGGYIFAGTVSGVFRSARSTTSP